MREEDGNGGEKVEGYSTWLASFRRGENILNPDTGSVWWGVGVGGVFRGWWGGWGGVGVWYEVSRQ